MTSNNSYSVCPQKESNNNLETNLGNNSIKNAKQKSHLFLPRESLLTPILFETPSGNFFCGLYITFTLIYILHRIILYFVEENTASSEWNQDFGLFQFAFRGFSHGLRIWFVYHLVLVLILYPLVKFFGHSKLIMTSLFLTMFAGILSYTTYSTISLDIMGPATRFALSIETMRIGLKMASFIKTVYLLKKEKKECNETEEPITSFPHFIYYLFAPTGLYAPSYPKSEKRSWSRIWIYLYILSTYIYIGFYVVRNMVYPLSIVGHEKLSLSLLLKQLFFSATVTHIYFVVTAAIQAYQCWSNLWAEILLFADRKFYSDFWTEPNVRHWNLKWNLILQNYLYNMVYLPMIDLLKNKTMAAVVTMIFSGFFFHEYELTLTIGHYFYFPFYIIPQVAMLFYHSDPKGLHPILRFVNFFLWISIHGCAFVVYALEYYSRRNCLIPEGRSVVADAFIPRFLSCVHIDYQK